MITGEQSSFEREQVNLKPETCSEQATQTNFKIENLRLVTLTLCESVTITVAP
jgi:hypothetical protein